MVRVEYVFQPSVSRDEFGRQRKGTHASAEDAAVRIPKEVLEAQAYVVEGGRPRQRVFALKRGAVAENDLAILQKTFANKARKGSSVRSAVVDDAGSATTIAGFYDRRDSQANAILNQISAKQKPLDIGAVVCRATSFTLNTPRYWKAAVDVFHRAAALHEAMDPERYRSQWHFVQKEVLPCYRIGSTAYTTVSANWNFRTKIHVDDGDFERGGGLLLVMGSGFEGGDLCFPRLGAAVELRPGDALAMDVFEWHGNLPIVHTIPDGHRMSIVLYARQNIGKCNKIIDQNKVLGIEWTPTPHAERFARSLGKAAEFFELHGKAPPIGARHGGVNVGEWCHNRRTDYKDGKLDPGQIAAIEAAIPAWTWAAADSGMEPAHDARRRRNCARFEMCAKLCADFRDAYGRLPKSGELVQNMDLGKWIDNRKQDSRKGRLSPEQAETLRRLQNDSTASRGSDDWSYDIAVPSYQRAETLRDKTAKLLERLGVPAERVSVFVADGEQQAAYEAALSASPYGRRIIVAAPGMRAVRNFIQKHYPEGARVVCMDDDLHDLLRLAPPKSAADPQKDRAVLQVEDLDSVVRDGFRLCLAHGATLWGVYPVKNAFFMNREPKIGLYYISGAFWGCINSHGDEVAVTLDEKEDYERTLLHFVKDGKVCRLDYVTIDTKNNHGQPGGMQAERTTDRVLESARDLAKRFPKLCTTYVRNTTGFAELKLAAPSAAEPEEEAE